MKAPFTFALLMIFLISGQAQQKSSAGGDYLFAALTVEQGLSNNNVTDIYQDSVGFLWVATNSGLNRYDGRGFKIFKNEPNDSTSLQEISIRKIMPGLDGQLWLLNRNNNFEVYEGTTETFHADLSPYARHYKWQSEQINFVYLDRGGRMWFAHPNKGLSIYDPKSNTTVYLQHEPEKPRSLSFNSISAIAENSAGEYWLVYANGAIDILDPIQLAVKRRIELLDMEHDLLTDDFKIFIDSEDDVWLYRYENGGGLYYYDRQADRMQHIYKNSSYIKLNNDQVRGIIENKPGEIWVGTDHGGINIIDKDSRTVQFINHEAENPHSLAQNSVYALFKDRSGVVWVGTFKNGINFYNEKLVRFPHIQHSLTSSRSLPYDDINCMVEDAQGNFYIGTNGNGLIHYDRASQKYTVYKHQKDNPHSLAGDIIVDLLMDSKGRLWIGTYLTGLSKLEEDTFTNYKPQAGNASSLAGESIWELYEDKEGNIWIGTLRNGLERYEPETDGFLHYQQNMGSYYLHCNYISAIQQDHLGNLWIGGGNGIDVVNFKNGSANYYNHLVGDTSTLVGDNVLDIYEDSQNGVWVATTQGLSYYDHRNQKFTNFSEKDGLPSDHIFKVLEDEEGHLWLSTTRGLSQALVDRSGSIPTIQFRNFGMGDGLQGNAFNENSALKTSRGELIFGGANGYNIFYPEQVKINQEKPRVVLTGFQLFNKNVPIGGEVSGRVLFDKSITLTDKITLKHHEDVISLEFSALNYIHSSKNTYKYQLEGFDNDWVEVKDGVTKAIYTNLDPGNYVFKVKASNNDGVWADEAAMVQIEVLAPFWQTPLAFLIYILLGIAIIIIIQREIISREKVRLQLEQDRQEARRMHEMDRMKTRFFTNVSHEFRTPLTLILTPIEKLLSDQHADKDKHHYLTIQRNARRLMNLINQLLDIKKIETEGVELQPLEGNIIRFLEETTTSFEDLSTKKHIQLEFQSDIELLFTNFDADKLEKIMFNLLSNAFKFTDEGGQIKVNVQYSPEEKPKGTLTIEVADTGMGISEEDQQQIFERYFTGQAPSDSLNQGSGIGLSIVREFTRLHGGTIRLKSQLGKGSVFTISLPVEALSPGMEEEEYREEWEADSDRKTILLVEDNEEFIHYLKGVLVEEYAVITAPNGIEGEKQAFQHIPDLIISDIMMPGKTGVELCQLLKHDLRTSHIPIILLTAKTSEEKQLEGLDSGANHYITKPFKVELLMLRIRNLLAERQLLQERFQKRIGVITSEVQLESMDDKLIQKAVKIVEDNMDNPELSVEMLSSELAMSRVHLYKKLTSLTGQKPLEFIRLIRLERAAQLLQQNQLNVSEVAYEVGYTNAKYFTKHFKARYKVIPSVYAKQPYAISENGDEAEDD
ncbi:hybrid sensor histidine kinase/response regulator [Echinicola pacifica]|uniref:histidine kinase n=1 Tax=Echinicola pacifica TaxID=346377 RepID=A0A918Q2H6_9BACT|nr:two-component regulator propeller domain-containing protein [Echinicola pacifica]GGZ31255.1 hybrid sensor histidine kinase/response regulator [Echinicola pacifica]